MSTVPMLTPPPGWTANTPAPDGTRFAAVAPADGGSLRPNAVVTVDDDPAGDTLADWQLATEAALDATLTRYLLLDLEHVLIEGHAGVRRLAAHVAPDGTAVTIEQWAVLLRGAGHTLTMSVPTFGFSAWLPLLRSMAATWTWQETA